VNDLTNDLLDDDRPIPLGRAAASAAAAQVAASDHASLETGAVSESHRATRIDRGPADAVAEVTLPEPASRVAESARRSGAPEPQGPHPLTGLRGFRLAPVVVERPYGGRHDLARFLIEFALVMAFVYALIVAFVLLVAHVRGTPV
jgi:hypothetical protein